MNGTTKNSLFLVKLQKEGTLQRGDEVLIDGRPGLIGTMFAVQMKSMLISTAAKD